MDQQQYIQNQQQQQIGGITSTSSGGLNNIKLSQMSHRPSESFMLNRSYINMNNTSTFIGGDTLIEQLKKSRIQNLPNYRKMNLSENLPFVVVFQTMQIERLSNEIESNRIKIKDFERQIFNAQNYEVQIRELTEKLFAYEQERENYSQETEKLNLICHQMYTQLEQMKRKYAEVDFSLKEKYQMQKSRNSELMQEIQKWKARYMAAEKSKNKELDDLRLMMQSQRKSMVDREMRQLTIKFQGQRGNLQNEIRKLRESMDYKNRQLDQHKQRNQKYELTIMQLRNSLGQLNEYENKIALITQQMLRLNQVLKNKQQQIDGYKQRQYQLQQKVRQQNQWQFQNKQLKSGLQNRTRQIQEWRIRCSKLQENVNRNRQLAGINADLTNKLSIAMTQLERVNNVIRSKLQQIQQWKQRLANQQMQTNRYKNLQRQIENYQKKIGVLTGEVQRLNNVLKGRLGQLEEWKGRYGKLQLTISNYVVVQKDNKDLKDKLNNLSRIVQQYKNKIMKYESDLNNMRLLQRKLDQSQKRASSLNQQIQRLNNVLRGKVQEVQDYKIRHSKLQYKINQYKSVQTKVKQYQNKLDALTQQLQKCMDMIRAKNQEIQRLNTNLMRLEDQLAYFKSAQLKLKQSQRIIQQLNSNLDNSRKQQGKLQQKYRALDGRARQLDSNLFSASQQKQKLSNLLKSRNNELDDIRIRYSKLQSQSYKARQLQNGYFELQNRYNDCIMELQRMERGIRQMEAQIDRQRALSTQLAFKVIVLSAQVQRNSGNAGIKSKDYMQLQQRFYQLQSSTRQKDNQMLVISQKMMNLQSQITFLKAQLQRYLVLITNNQKQAKLLQKEIMQYQDFARRIHILSAEIDRLASQNGGLEADIKRLRLRYADQISGETRHEGICLMFVLMASQIEGLRARVAEKEIQFHEMRKSILEPVRTFK